MKGLTSKCRESHKGLSITENHQKEALSIAYVEAVSASAGVNIAFAARHDYGIDGSFRPVVIIGNQRCETGHHLNFQLKATTRWKLERDHVVYPMEVRTFNHLVRIAAELGACPTVLLLLCLPDGPENWLSHSTGQLILRRCCYYLRLQGSESTNTDNVTVRIPTNQHLSPESLILLIEQMKQGKLT